MVEFGKQDFTGNETFQLLVEGSQSARVVDEWMERNYAFDLRIRRAKTPKKVVIELKDPIFAAYICRWFNAQVNIKR